MKVNELRIGNLVFDRNKKIGLMNTVLLEQLQLWGNTHYSKIAPARPIPLTEEWLLKFGFTKDKNSYVMGVHINRFSGLMKIKFDPLIQWVFSVGSYKDITRVKYVHQLQNLYYALTGTELTIKN